MEMDRIVKRVYVGEYAGILSAGRSRKRWIDTMKECLMKKGLDVRQARRLVQDRSEWRGFVWGNVLGVPRRDEPHTLARCHSCWLPQLYETCGRKSVCGRA